MSVRRTAIGVAVPVLAGLLASCRTTSGINGGISGGIGHDICAVMLAVDIRVSDHHGEPVADAEVWELARPQPDPPYGKAWRLGITNGGGRLETRDCYMDSLEFGFWSPAEEPVTLDLMIFRVGVGASKVTLRPDTAAVLRDGNLLGVSPEQWQLGTRAPYDPERFQRAFALEARVTLERSGR